MTASPAPREAPGRMRKHSLVIAGHSTSISLESAFWDALREQARERGLSVAALVAEIDATRGEANLSSALRVHILQAFRDKATRG
ncbi:ribbon-helix-helix domain-containing protein [Rhodoblastus sp.]|jgi:predicted DNA-binding ribbon-helix-helix protein|uniref:ribbon-helix-helix domain-containing protein n=1 Tax=Rhodoblastus sp. TaxID=1962975 RepID=UPI0025FED63C|nr:ribbon-helix-helix domain-containing protein [Rhodoblastus sp.]